MRISVRTALVCALVMAGAVGGATPAQSSVSQGLVAATTQSLDQDWDDEGEVSRYAHSYSGATGLWQAVLWADGAIEQDGTRFDASDIDCEFGPNTERATKSWQSTMGGLAVDGRAGPRTWGRADSNLRLVKYNGEGQYTIEYVGRYAGRTFQVVRNGVDGSSSSGWYWTTAWDFSFFPYHYKPDDCGGVPRGW